MSRHRNVRSMNYDEEYYDEDESYGHSVEDNYCVSPGTAAQFTFNREKDVALSHYMDEQGGIPEEDEPEEGEETLHGSHDYTRPTLSSIDEARLNSCLEDVRNVLGESVPDSMMVSTIIRHNFSIESSLNELLNKQVEEAPKPQREPRQNRRNRSQGSSDNSAPAKPQLELDFPTEPPTVILKEPRKPLTSVPQPKIIEPYLSQPTVVKSMSPQRTPKGKNRTAELAPLAAKAKNDNKVALTKDAKAVSSESKDKRTDTLDVEKSASSEKIENKDQLATPKKERFIPPLPRSSSKSKYEKYDLKEEYKKRQGGKDMLNMVVIGHVDAGKSTLMGHVLYQLGSVNQRVMHKYEQESKKLGKSSFAYAWVLDETEEERARGVTMDIAQTKFETPHKIITLLDAPGHKDFIPNMITGTAQADVAILVVNATKGEFETGFESGGQTREHALLARSLGVHQLIVAVNKMDTVGWDPARYDDIVRKLGLFLKQAGFREGDTNFVPVSGLGGENLAKPIKEPKLAAWYKGLNLLEQIDKFKPVPRAVDRPVRIMVSDVFKGQQGSGLTAAGKVVSGSVQIGDRLAVMPAAEYCIVKSITNNEEAVNFAFSGDHVIVGVAGIDITNIVVGSVFCDVQTPVVCASRILARIVLFNLEIPMTRGFTVIFHYQTVTEPAIVKKLVSHLNKSTGEVIKNKPKCLMKNSSAVVEIEFEFPLCVELYKDNKEMGRFMLRSGGHTIAAGLIEEVLKTKAGEGVKKGGEGAESQGAMGN
ncbi:HBS1-like protein isoform X1 [Mya arenaria]|uniref:HBS1-like protein isoform X1 n=1 Tax=Mya arenaria TaxID=6604 RepID=UPI0022E94C2A|nr:HBS1-like protein isoform X1 [Mya arenaria]